MVVLDTPVVSELMRSEPHPMVLTWLNDQSTRGLFVTAVTEAEVYAGIAILPEGARRRGLYEAAERTFARLFSARILSFDSVAAHIYAEMAASRRARGHALSLPDGQIAAIARSHDMTVATRNVKDFDYINVTVVNPWASG